MNKYILEFANDEVLLIASMVHALLKEHPEAKLPRQLLDSLVTQTTSVSREPDKHGVGIVKPTKANIYYDAAQFNYELYIPEAYYGS